MRSTGRSAPPPRPNAGRTPRGVPRPSPASAHHRAVRPLHHRGRETRVTLASSLARGRPRGAGRRPRPGCRPPRCAPPPGSGPGPSAPPQRPRTSLQSASASARPAGSRWKLPEQRPPGSVLRQRGRRCPRGQSQPQTEYIGAFVPRGTAYRVQPVLLGPAPSASAP